MERKKTLLHSVGFNIAKLESVMNNGLLSEKKAKERNIPLARNFSGYNLSDMISTVSIEDVCFEDEDNAYNLYIAKGITFSFDLDSNRYIYQRIETFFNDKDHFNDKEPALYINHPDEVLVKDEVKPNEFKEIILPKEYIDYSLANLPMINLKSTSYENIKNTCDNLIEYMKSYNYEIDLNEYNLLLEELKFIIKELSNNQDDSSLQDDFIDIKCSLSTFLATNLSKLFEKILNKKEVTLLDIVEYINNKTLNLPIVIKDYKRGKNVKR